METLVKEKYIEINVDHSAQIIELKWNGFVKSKNYREALDKAIEIAKEHSLNKWLTDATNVKVVSISDQEWVMNDWFPRALEAGYKYQALIIPRDEFGKTSSNELISEVDGKSVIAKNFMDYNTALEWLSSFN